MADFYSFLSACKEGDSNAAVRILSAQEFDPRWLSRQDGGLTPFHYACRSGNVRVVRILVEEYHCDPEIKGGRGGIGTWKITPLHEACRYKCPVIYLYNIFIFKFCCYRPCLSGRVLGLAVSRILVRPNYY